MKKKLIIAGIVTFVLLILFIRLPITLVYGTALLEIVLFLLLFLFPIPLYFQLKKNNTKRIYIYFFILSIIIFPILAFITIGFSDFSDGLILQNYGYNFDAMSDSARYGNVESENIEKVKQIEKRIMGIGWPLKAIFAIIFYMPFIFVLTVAIYLIDYCIHNKTYIKKLIYYRFKIPKGS